MDPKPQIERLIMSDDDDIITKSDFAALISVHQSRVSQYIAEGKIFGNAIVGDGHRARIRVSVARDQLKQTLDIDQRSGANARAQLEGISTGDGASQTDPPQPTIDDRLKRERLEGLELANERMREERAHRAGLYIKADDARRGMGRVAADLMALFDSALPEFATAVAARSNMTSRDAAHVLRTTWHAIRERSSQREANSAASLPTFVAALAGDTPEGLATPNSEEAPS
jgi:hypothetical protein